MWRFIYQQAASQDPRVQAFQVRATRYPGWVWKGTLIVAAPLLLIAGLVLLLLLIGVAVLGGLAFFVLSTLSSLFDRPTLPPPEGDERENVRVIDTP